MASTDDEPTAVVFRKWPAGDILALFPEIPADNRGFLCSAYQHIGQHGPADYHLCIQRTTPASASEFKQLLDELHDIGYKLITICFRIGHDTHERRRALATA